MGFFRRFGFAALLLGASFTACRCTPKPAGETPAAASASASSQPLAIDAAAPSPPSATETAALDVDTGCPPELADARRGGTRPNSFTAPSDADMKAMRAASTKLMKEGKPDVAALGFEVIQTSTWKDVYILRELDTKKRGGGAYVFRRGSNSTVVVQAPHTFYDEGTFPLACELFQRLNARALYINTVHRYKSAPERDGKHPADVAHAPVTLFQAATEGAVDALIKPWVVQVHGFADRKVGARAVVSVGEKRPGNALVARVATALEAMVGPRILKYPEDTNELGATTNVQGSIVRAAGGRFLHVEMDDGLRRDLVSDPALRGRALDALGTAFTRP